MSFHGFGWFGSYPSASLLVVLEVLGVPRVLGVPGVSRVPGAAGNLRDAWAGIPVLTG